MKTSAILFPFDLFGSPGTGAGAQLVADELREILADNRRETVATRAHVYSPHVRLRETTFDRVEDLADWRERGRRLARGPVRQGDFLLWLAGNHLGVLPVLDELAALGDDALVVQLDAHLDIHHFRDCTPELSHGNFLLHRTAPLPPVVNVGHRDLLLPPEYIAKHFHRTFSASRLALDPTGVLNELRLVAREASRIYLDIDCDVFDPVFFPGVGQPVPFGLTPAMVLAVLDAVWSERVMGLCVSEFDPGRDRDDRSLTTLVWLLEHVLLRRYEGS
jgi:arginase family enzyme